MEFMNCLATAAETIGQWGFSEGFASIMSEIENPTFVGWLVKGLLDAVGNYGCRGAFYRNTQNHYFAAGFLAAFFHEEKRKNDVRACADYGKA